MLFDEPLSEPVLSGNVLGRRGFELSGSVLLSHTDGLVDLSVESLDESLLPELDVEVNHCASGNCPA